MTKEYSDSGRPNDDKAKGAKAKALRERTKEMDRANIDLEELPHREKKQLLHELHQHQAELEMQNEELRATERALEASRVKYFDLYNLALTGYFTISGQSLILEANLIAAHLLGTQKDRLINQSFTRFIIPEDQNLFCLFQRKLFETGKPQSCELRMARLDGVVLWAHLRAAVGADIASGQPVCHAVISDITERKALEKVQAQFSAIINSSADAIISKTLNGIITGWNPSAEKMFGYAEKEAIGQPMTLIMSPEHAYEEGRILDKIHNGEIVEQFETVRKRKNGDIFSVSLTVSLVSDGAGTIIGASKIVRDITERKAIEDNQEKTGKKLAAIKILADEASEYAESIINTVREPLIALDQDLRVVKVSRSFYDFFKVKPEETMGQFIYDLGNKQWDIPQLRELLETILPEKTSFDNYEVEHDFTTIGRRTMLLNARQIDRVLGMDRVILLAIEDITDRKDAQKNLMAAKNVAEEAVKIKDKFISLVMHDIRSPLSSVIMLMKVIMKLHTEPQFDDYRTTFEMTVGACERMMEMADQVLESALLQEGSIKLSRKMCNIKIMSDAVISDLSYLAEKKKVVLRNEVPNDTEIYVDEVLFQRVIHNLMVNALKFTNEGGMVTVCMLDGQNTVAVKDTGTGIGKKLLPELFKYEVHTTTTGTHGERGTGLGLPMSMDIMKAHDGTIEVTSHEGQGSTFSMIFPEAKVPNR